MKKIIVLAIFISLAAVACVKKEYDLSKINTDMTLFEKEGIQFPLPVTDPVDFNIFKDNGVMDKSVHRDAEDASLNGVDFSKASQTELDNGIAMEGSVKFNFSDLPDAFHNPMSKIVFDDASFFTIEMDNSSTCEAKLSCDIVNASDNSVIGQCNGIRVGTGKNIQVKIPFKDANLHFIPENVIIRNIKIIPVMTKADFSGVLSYLKSQVDMSSVVKNGSVLVFEYKFNDLFSELGIDLNNYMEYIEATYFEISATYITDVPVSMTGTCKGDVVGSIALEGPTPKDGTEITIKVDCEKGLASVKAIDLSVTFTAKADIDLNKIEDYSVSVTPQSIMLKKGIDVSL